MIHHMSAVILAVRAMPGAITFYTQLGFTLVYGEPLSTVQYPPSWGRFGQPRPGTEFSADVVGADDFPRGQCRDPLPHRCRPRVDPFRTLAWLLGRAVFAPYRSQWALTQLCATPPINSDPRVFARGRV